MELTKPLVDLNDVEYHIRQWLDKNDGGVGRIDANLLVNYVRSRLKLSRRTAEPQPAAAELMELRKDYDCVQDQYKKLGDKYEALIQSEEPSPAQKKCHKCGRGSSFESWERLADNCPICGDMFSEDTASDPSPAPVCMGYGCARDGSGPCPGHTSPCLLASPVPVDEEDNSTEPCPECGCTEKVQSGDPSIHECAKCYHAWKGSAPVDAPSGEPRCKNCTFANLRTWEPSNIMLCDDCVRNGGERDHFELIEGLPTSTPFGCGGDLMSMAEAKAIASPAPVPAPSVDVETYKKWLWSKGFIASRDVDVADVATWMQEYFSDLLANPPQEWLERRDAEWEAAIPQAYIACNPSKTLEQGARFSGIVRASLTRKPVERVTVIVKPVKNTETLYEVRAGDSHVFTSADERDAERYAAGLRAELEKQ